MTAFKSGKLPARPNAVLFKMARYLDVSELPEPPAVFGHEKSVADWRMLANSSWGDCVWAGAAHETMLWNASAGRSVGFTDSCVLSDYSAVTGFNPRDPATDRGTDMELAARYRRTTGVLDAAGGRHKVGAYLAIKAGDVSAHLTAAWLFGAVGIGIQFPSSAMDQFDAGEPWDVVEGDRIDGGHYIPLIGADEDYLYVVTWGRVQKMTRRFFTRYNDESIVYLSPEMLTSGTSPEGFDLDQLTADLAKLGQPAPPESALVEAARALASDPATTKLLEHHHVGYLRKVAHLVADVVEAAGGE